MNENLPPPNRALAWYRFMLWMMPACVAMMTAYGIGWLIFEMGWRRDLAILLWFMLNIATTIGIGFFESQFHRTSSSEPANSAAIFTALQILVIPAVLLMVAFVLYVVGV